jgi:hypothetical protein
MDLVTPTSTSPRASGVRSVIAGSPADELAEEGMSRRPEQNLSEAYRWHRSKVSGRQAFKKAGY